MADFRALTIQSGTQRQIQDANTTQVGLGILNTATRLEVASWRPLVDGTRALMLSNAIDEPIVIVDTTNGRVVINNDVAPQATLETYGPNLLADVLMGFQNIVHFTTTPFGEGVGGSLGLGGEYNSARDQCTFGLIKGEKDTATDGDLNGRIVFYTGAGIFGIMAERMRINRNGQVGINTAAPNVMLDVRGDFALRETSRTLVNGANTAVATAVATFLRITGPTAAFTIHGFAGGFDGKLLTVYNSTAQNMTIANQSGTEGTAANRIITCTGADVATVGVGVTQFVYSGIDTRWILTNLHP
jgi:hypothetical protein